MRVVFNLSNIKEEKTIQFSHLFPSPAMNADSNLFAEDDEDDSDDDGGDETGIPKASWTTKRFVSS